MAKRENYSTDRTYEVLCGYSRGVRIDDAKSIICIGGTTSTNQESQVLHVGKAYAQTREIFGTIETSLEALGASLGDVVRTRMFVVNLSSNQDDVCRAHKEVFGAIRPCETMVGVTELSHPDMLVEIEVDAVF
ncbi:Rid family hydrolase [uncultured Roseovarius sp.]|uniref:Rid family hydrolase n=1 Tax=uncultured Roseovarius sp. TaxID=293344 RepID=UPI002628EE53|nr:Rid family hydrolase [uncultured Roseovarius sp.]